MDFDNYHLFKASALIALAILFLFKKSKGGKVKHLRNINKSKKIISKIRQIKNPAQTMSYLRKIDPFVFEEVILTALELDGFKVVRNERYTGDGGIDGKVYLGGELYYIQAKRYPGKVVTSHIIEFEDIVIRDGVKGLFIHTGSTPLPGKEFAKKSNHIEIISGRKLLKLLSPELEITN